jgi:Protein of unknown function (DUF2442)
MMTRRKPDTEATVRYDPATKRVVVRCANRAEFHLPIETFHLPERATLKQLASVTLSEDENGIAWKVFDVEFYSPYLMAVLLGRSAWRLTPTIAPNRAASRGKGRESQRIARKRARKAVAV